MAYTPPHARMRQIKQNTPAQQRPSPPRDRESDRAKLTEILKASEHPMSIDEALAELAAAKVEKAPPVEPELVADVGLEPEAVEVIEAEPEVIEPEAEAEVVEAEAVEPEVVDNLTPSMEWKRSELNAKALELGIAAPEKLGSKQDTLNAILAVLVGT